MRNIFNKFLLFLFFCVSFFFSINSYSQTNQNLDNLFRLAQSYEQASQPEKAEPIYRNLVEQQAWNYSYFEALTRFLTNQKRYPEAINLIEERIKLNPQDINLYGLLGSTYYISENLKQAYESWERGISTNSSSVVVYRVMSNYAIENRVYDKAIEYLERGKKYTDDPMVFSFDLANIFAANMRFEDATREYLKLLEKRSDQLELIKSRIGSYLSRQGAFEPIRNTIKQYCEKNPTSTAYTLLTYVYNFNGEFEKGLKSAIEYQKQSNDNGNFIFVFAQEAFRSRDYKSAALAYEYFIKNFSSSQLIPIAQSSYAITMEEAVNLKFSDQAESWKPFLIKRPIGSQEYKTIINAYDKLIAEYPNNLIAPQSLFRIGEIYRNQLKDLSAADSIFNLIISKYVNSEYAMRAYKSKGRISLEKGNLKEAKDSFTNAVLMITNDQTEKDEANFYLAKIEFWNGNFSTSQRNFKSLSANLETDFANDAIELSALINFAKRDSISLTKYALGDLYSIQNKFKEAANEFKTLADNPNLFLLNEFANYKLAEMMIAQNDFSSSVKILEVLSDSSKTSILSDKSLFLLAKVYHLGLKDHQKAVEFYQKLLVKFPNSLYFDPARESLNTLLTNNG